MAQTFINPYSVYSSKEAALVMGVSVPTIQRWIKEGKIKGAKIGGKNYIVRGVDLIDIFDRDGFDTAAVSLEHALIALDFGMVPHPTEVTGSPFYNYSATMLVRFAREANNRAELLRNIANFINQTRKARPKIGNAVYDVRALASDVSTENESEIAELAQLEKNALEAVSRLGEYVERLNRQDKSTTIDES